MSEEQFLFGFAILEDLHLKYHKFKLTYFFLTVMKVVSFYKSVVFTDSK